jgi:hypothetical protein
MIHEICARYLATEATYMTVKTWSKGNHLMENSKERVHETTGYHLTELEDEDDLNVDLFRF